MRVIEAEKGPPIVELTYRELTNLPGLYPYQNTMKVKVFQTYEKVPVGRVCVHPRTKEIRRIIDEYVEIEYFRLYETESIPWENIKLVGYG